MCLHSCVYVGGSDSQKQVCVLLCGRTVVQLTRGMEGGLSRERGGMVTVERTPLGSTDASLLRTRVWYVCKKD